MFLSFNDAIIMLAKDVTNMNMRRSIDGIEQRKRWLL